MASPAKEATRTSMPLISILEDAAPVGIAERAAASADSPGVGDAVAVTRVVEVDRVLVPLEEVEAAEVVRRAAELDEVDELAVVVAAGAAAMPLTVV